RRRCNPRRAVGTQRTQSLDAWQFARTTPRRSGQSRQCTGLIRPFGAFLSSGETCANSEIRTTGARPDVPHRLVKGVTNGDRIDTQAGRVTQPAGIRLATAAVPPPGA